MGRFGNGDLVERTEQYALRAIGLFRHVRESKREDSLIIGRQYLRAATSIGANLVEADAAESRKDFVHKCAIALKEARECRYWLRLMSLAGLIQAKRLGPLLDETQQVISVLVAVIVKAKKNPDKRE